MFLYDAILLPEMRGENEPYHSPSFDNENLHACHVISESKIKQP